MPTAVSPPQPLPPVSAPQAVAVLSPRDRENLLNNIHHTWIEGVLHTGLQQVVRLELGLEIDQHVLQRRLPEKVWQARQLAGGETVSSIFVESGRSMLILGAPGSGKTTTLLELGKALLAQARRQPQEPIPLILSLASWGQEPGARRRLWERFSAPVTPGEAFETWCVEAAFTQYQLARETTRDLLHQRQLILLLDGLDEVAVEARATCLTALNATLPQEMAITCRLEDYAGLEERLNLASALKLQPLSDRQIEQVLAKHSRQLAGLQTLLHAERELWELARTPLMLNIMSLTADGLTPQGLTAAESADARRTYLFDTYTEQMFARRPLAPALGYDQAQATSWLQSLAQLMADQGVQQFDLAHIQPSWLPTPALYRQYRRIGRFIFGPLGLLQVGLTAYFLMALAGVQLADLHLGNWPMLAGGLLLSCLGGFVFTYRGRRIADHISTNARRRLARPSLRTLLRRLGEGMIFSLVLGLIVMLACFGRSDWQAGLLCAGTLGGTLLLLAAIRSLPVGRSGRPNQAIHTTWRTSLIDGLIVALPFGLVLGPLAGLGLAGGATLALLGGLSGALSGGLIDVIQHYIVRFLLAQAGRLPFPYPWQERQLTTFLDGMVERILLQRVGGRWRFVHNSVWRHIVNS